MTLAKYYGQDEIVCNVFKGDISVYDLHGENVMLTKNVLLQAGFTLEEIRELDEIRQIIKR